MDRLRSPSRTRPRTRSADAERRLRGFLRGFGIDDDAALRELVRRLARLAPGGTSAALEEAAGRWFASVLGQPENDLRKALAAGRVAWLDAGAGRRWPLALFGEPPPVLIESIRRTLPMLPPAMLGDAMPAAPLLPPRLRNFVPMTARLRARTA